jgi:hypothetical protein
LIDEDQQKLTRIGDMQFRTFWFRAASDVHIGLFDCILRTADGVVDDNDEFYEIVLGADTNTRAVIRRTAEGENVVEVEGEFCSDVTWTTVTVVYTDDGGIFVG